LSFLWLAACVRQEAPQTEAIRPVKTMVVPAGNPPLVRSFPARVEASKRVELAFQVPGLLVKLPVKEGQAVKKGQVIARLRQDEFQARTQMAQGQVDQARTALNALRLGERTEEQLRREAQARAAAAKLANARTEFDRYGRLVKSSAVSRAEYELAATNYRVAEEEHKAAVQLLEKGTVARTEDIEAQEAQVRVLEGRLAEAKIQLGDSTLRAPYDGILAQRLVDEGQTITANKPVVIFQNVGDIDVVADVPEAAMAADVRSPAITQLVAELSSAPGIQFPVRVKEAAQVADPVTQTFQVRTGMRTPRRITVLPGMTATVIATYRQPRTRRVLVPVSAVSKQDTGEQVVWILGRDQTVHCRAVKLGAAAGGQIEILDGVRPGERIVVAGVTFLREGMQVRDLGTALGGSPT
jgi:RND family efflux transporter MFP subunit